jgi:hypothetical protein
VAQRNANEQRARLVHLSEREKAARTAAFDAEQEAEKKRAAYERHMAQVRAMADDESRRSKNAEARAMQKALPGKLTLGDALGALELA